MKFEIMLLRRNSAVASNFVKLFCCMLAPFIASEICGFLKKITAENENSEKHLLTGHSLMSCIMFFFISHYTLISTVVFTASGILLV